MATKKSAIDYSKIWEIKYTKAQAPLMKFVAGALKAQGFKLQENGIVTTTDNNRFKDWNYMCYEDRQIYLSMNSDSSNKKFTIEDVFNGNILKYCTEIDTTITLANGKKVKLSKESYLKLAYNGR